MSIRTAKGRPQKLAPSSGGGLGIWIAILGFLGMGVSGYLTYAHLMNASTVCLEGFECDAILSSPYAQLWGIPLSLFGFAMFAVLAALGVMQWRRLGSRQDLIALAAYTVALASVLFSLYLYYLEIFELKAFCTWCVVSSIVVVALMVLTSLNLFRVGSVRAWESDESGHALDA
jgi:uncharacterized membrane protein